MLDKLWELQIVTSRLAASEKALKEKPESFAAIDSEFQAVSSEIEKLDERLQALGAERRKAERELQDEQEVLKKYQGQLMQVKNQQQYAAAWKEIDAARKRVKELEELALAKLGEIETAETELAGKQKALEPLKARHDEEYQKWQDSLSELRSEVDEIRRAASAIEDQLPPPVRKQFQQILTQRGGVAVSRVESGACSSCRFKIRSQAMQQARRGELTTCEGCRRILYVDRVAV